MDQTLLKLRRALEDGYNIQRKRNVYRTPSIPTAEDPNYKSFEHSMGEHYRQNHHPRDFTDWAQNLETLFSSLGLNFSRFKHLTESDIVHESDSHAKTFKRRLNELDKITNNQDHFRSYLLLPAHPEVTFEDSRLAQGYQFHKFNQSNPHTVGLLTMLWKDRRIETEDDHELEAGKPIPLTQIYETLNLTHDRFESAVRAIHAAVHRKNIDLRIKYPKQQVQLVVVQDSM